MTNSMKSLGIDIGSSSVKVSLLDIGSGKCVASSTNPGTEMPIKAVRNGWAEQNPQMWWDYVCQGIRKIGEKESLSDVKCIGITYQMHGLVCIGKDGLPVRGLHNMVRLEGRGDRQRGHGKHRKGEMPFASAELPRETSLHPRWRG